MLIARQVNVRSGSRLCENALGQRMRRIVFSTAFFLKKLAVQSTPISTKSKWKFYTQVGHGVFTQPGSFASTAFASTTARWSRASTAGSGAMRRASSPEIIRQAAILRSTGCRAASANPCRHDGCAGRQPSSCFALAFDAALTCVIIETMCSPAKSRPTQAGM